MDDDPLWFSADQVESLNALVVARTGEDHRVVNRHLLESAVARPMDLHTCAGETDRFVLAARLAEAIGKNRCFLHGNARTALVAGVAFLRLNDVAVTVDTPDAARAIEALIVGTKPVDELVALFRAAVRAGHDDQRT